MRLVLHFLLRTFLFASLTWATCTILMYFAPAAYVPFRYAGF